MSGSAGLARRGAAHRAKTATLGPTRRGRTRQNPAPDRAQLTVGLEARLARPSSAHAWLTKDSQGPMVALLLLALPALSRLLLVQRGALPVTQASTRPARHKLLIHAHFVPPVQAALLALMLRMTVWVAVLLAQVVPIAMFALPASTRPLLAAPRALRAHRTLLQIVAAQLLETMMH